MLVSEAAKAGAENSETTNKGQELQKSFGLVQSLLARAHSKGIIHRNTAARKTKRLHSLLKKATVS